MSAAIRTVFCLMSPGMVLASLAVILMSPAMAEPIKSEGPLAFEGCLLELPGKVKLSAYEDIDADGRIDVLAVHAGETIEENPRYLVVYFQREQGFSPEPDIRYRIPDEVALIDLGNVRDDSAGMELLMLGGAALRWIALPRPEDSASRMLEGNGEILVEVAPLFAHADPERLGQRDFARPVDGAERATLFIPRTNGYRIYYPDDEYAGFAEFSAEHGHRVWEETYRVRVANLMLADVDGDGWQDLAFSHRDRLQVHLQRDGRFLADADQDLNLRILTQADREAPEGVEELVGMTIDDFDGDDLADLFVWKTVVRKKAVINDKKQYQLYRNRGGSFPVVPDQAFVLKSLDKPKILDLNGDSRLDMVTGYFEFSLANIIKALLTKRFQIDLSFFLHEEHGFPDQPTETRNFKIRISLSDMDENFAPAVVVTGDYDGDDNLDFLLQTDDRKVEIFLGGKNGQLFEREASVKLEAYACEDSHVADFNGDGRDDIAFSHFPDREPFNTRWIHVVLSR